MGKFMILALDLLEPTNVINIIISISYDFDGSADPWIDFSLRDFGSFGEMGTSKHDKSSSDDVEISSSSIESDVDDSIDNCIDSSFG